MAKTKVFYGWWMVLAAFFCLSINSGTGFYSFSLFISSLEADFGWSRASIMTAYTVFMILSGVLSPFAGRLIDRYGAGKVMTVGAILTGLGFFFLNGVNNPWSFSIGWAIRGIGSAATGTVPAAVIVSNWFRKRRGLAIGLMGTGYGVGGSVIAPLIGNYLIPDLGWRMTYLVLAFISLAVIPIALALKTKPSDVGLYPDGMQPAVVIPEKGTGSPAPQGLSLRAALLTATLWLFCIGYFVSNFSITAGIQNEVPHLEDIGFPLATAATALGAVGMGSLVGKFLFGWVCDRMEAKYACVIGFIIQLGAVLVLNSVQSDSSVAFIWLYAILAGLGLGSWLPTMTVLVANNFGLASYGTIFGITNMAQSVGAAVGPLFAGHMYDTTHTYHQAFIIMELLYVIAIPAILFAERRRQKQAQPA